MMKKEQERKVRMEEDIAQVKKLLTAYRKMRKELAKVVVGQDEVIDLMIIAILAKGHCLLEGVPGLAKTLMIRSLADAMSLSFGRIQFTPDLMPADITGTDMIQEDSQTGQRKLVFQPGPIFHQAILADEINRTPPKTQAALLQAMQEGEVSAGGKTYLLDKPFFVLATQNPIEQEGTYPLPEAQRDRFTFLVKVDYPTREQEREIVRRTTSAFSAELSPVISGEDIVACQQIVKKVPLPDHVMDFVLDLVRRTRTNTKETSKFTREMIDWGAGPRACQQLVLAGKAHALLQQRFHVTMEDIEAVCLPTLRHRIVPTFAAEAQGLTVDDIIREVMDATPRGKLKKAL